MLFCVLQELGEMSVLSKPFLQSTETYNLIIYSSSDATHCSNAIVNWGKKGYVIYIS